MAAVGLDLSHAERKLLELARALRAEEDGKALKKDLVKHLRSAAGPARQEVRAAIRSAASHGHAGRSIRSAIASRIQVQAKLTGKAVGVKIIAKETTSVRGFRNAPRRFNSAAGWHHPTFGEKPDEFQMGKPGWFDDTLSHRRPEFQRGVEDAMDETARRIARRV